MSDDRIDEDEVIGDLLAAERRRPNVPSPVADALFQSIMAASIQSEQVPNDAPARAPSGEAPSPTRSLLASRPLIAIVSLAAGIGIGAAARPLLDPDRAPTSVVAPAVVVTAAPVISTPPTSSEDAPTARPVDALPSAPTPVVRLSPSPRPSAVASAVAATSRSAESSLGAERALVETARSALARGDAASALGSLDVHAKNHPRGQLGEERDALLVQALAQAGRKWEAVEQAARFRLAYPTSVFLPSVDAAVR